MWKCLKRFIVLLLIVVVALFAGVSWYVYNNQSTIEQALVSQLNNSLETEVTVRGDVDLTLIPFFPNLALEINDIVIMGSTGQPNDTLIAAGKLYLVTSIVDLFNGNWRIQEVEIEDGSLRMTKSVAGEINYRFVKQGSENDTTDQSFLLSIEQAALKNIQFSYADDQAEVYLDIQVYKAYLSGNFSSEELAIDADIKTLANHIRIKDIQYINSQEVNSVGTIAINTEANTYNINTKSANIGVNRFGLNGYFGIRPDETDLHVDITGEDLVLTEVLQLFPGKVSSQFAEYGAKGNLEFTVGINGVLSKKENPLIDIAYKLSDGSIHYNKLGLDIDKLDVIGTYTNGKQRNLASSAIKITELRVAQANNKLSAVVAVQDLNKPQLDITANGQIELSILQPLLQDSTGKIELGGLVKIEQASYQGTVVQLKMLDSYKPIKLNFDGTFEQAYIKFDDTRFSLNSGHMKLSPWTINAENLALQLNENEFTINGSLKYWKSYYYNLMGDDPQPVQPLTVDLDIRTDRSVYLTDTSKSYASGTTLPSAERIFDMAGSVSVSVKQLQYDKLQLENVMADIELGKGSLRLSSLTMETMDGDLKASGNATIQGNNIVFSSTGNILKLDINSCFRQLDNFGQETITAEHLKGTVTATFSTNGRFSNYQLDKQSFELVTELALENGELLNFEPLENLSRFVKLDELKHIQFSSLRNTLEIKNKTIHIPQMIIKSNAMNMSIAGTHTFDNMVDYKVKVNAYDILANKIRRSNRKDQFYEVVDENSFNFFISMRGPLDDPEINYDKQGVKDRFKQQGSELKQAIRGLYNDYNAEKEKRDWQLPAQDEFIEWEENNPE